MSNTESSPNLKAPPVRNVLHVVRSYLNGTRSLVVAGGVVVVAGLAFNWAWLVAAGIAPLLLATLPCAAMCALGLCMTRLTGRSCSTDAASRKGIASSPTNTPEVEPASSPAAGVLDMPRQVSAATGASSLRHPETTRKRSINHA